MRARTQPGSVAIFARGTFVGDSLLDRLNVDETAWVPYAIDSGTTVTREVASDERPVRIATLRDGLLTVENAQVRLTHYAIAAGREPAHTIYLRHAKAAGYTPTGLPPQTIVQGDAYLIPVVLVPGKTSELTVDEREPVKRTFELAGEHASGRVELGAYIDGSALPATVADKLGGDRGARRAREARR